MNDRRIAGTSPGAFWRGLAYPELHALEKNESPDHYQFVTYAEYVKVLQEKADVCRRKLQRELEEVFFVENTCDRTT